MKNTVEIPNQKKERYKSFAACVCIIFFSVCILVGIFTAIYLVNFNGKTDTLTVEIKKVGSGGKTDKVYASTGEEYSLGFVSKKLDWISYEGKTLKFVVPQDQFSGKPWVFGVIDGDETLIDYNEVMASKKADYRTMLLVFSAIAFVALAGFVFFVFKQSKMPKTEIVSDDDLVWNCFANCLPKSPKRKKFEISFTIFIVLMLFVFCPLSLISDKNVSEALKIVLWSVIGALFVGGIVLFSILSLKFFPKDEIKFYSKYYPFDGDNISHLTMKKSLKKQKQWELYEKRRRNPHGFEEHGNGFLTTFTEKGLLLHSEELSFEAETSGVFENLDDSNAPKIVYQDIIPYEQLNFIAIPKYRKTNNMFGIIIKSRLDEDVHCPLEIEYNLSFVFDSNLMKSLKTFNVKVENLDYILANVEKLMNENCPKSKNFNQTLNQNMWNF